MKFILLLGLFLLPHAFASSKQKIDVLGTSPKGQFVAVEEYGYRPGTHMYFVNIRVMNVWKKEYVGDKVQIELPATRPFVLKKARKEALEMAQNTFKKYQIIP
jgi:predicted secreted protein